MSTRQSIYDRVEYRAAMVSSFFVSSLVHRLSLSRSFAAAIIHLRFSPNSNATAKIVARRFFECASSATLGLYIFMTGSLCVAVRHRSPKHPPTNSASFCLAISGQRNEWIWPVYLVFVSDARRIVAVFWFSSHTERVHFRWRQPLAVDFSTFLSCCSSQSLHYGMWPRLSRKTVEIDNRRKCERISTNRWALAKTAVCLGNNGKTGGPALCAYFPT